ncbi:MAG: hypothetical protein PHG14_15710 [Desulfobacter postgatei]|uniref:hypothetical protein n=1 Tax=Desulfobacter postgatei TaxID=2293 RepID=UPI0023F1030B|nr:hypothetical protein [Desulfobacter postgatei]MDD4275162.1 hypothetical protein [Desulfobacter postgatei]
MSIIRVQKNSNYSVISNVHLQDETLSWKAKGILSYLLSKPDNWQVYIAHLKNQSTDGRDSTSSGVRELINAGYISRDYTRNEAGQMTGRSYVVYESSFEQKAVNKGANPKTENPLLDNPTLDNPTLLNTDHKQILKKTTTDVQPPPERVDPVDHGQEKTSPSFSESELISILAALMLLVPEKHRKPSIEKTIERGLKARGEDYVRAAIAYTVANSNGNTTQKFRAYLGKTIEHGWADGWEPDKAPDQSAIKNEFSKMPDAVLRMLASAGNQFAMAELKTRV